MIIGFVGRMGSGKTLSMTRYAYKYYCAGYKIYSNIRFNFPYTEYTLQDLVDFANNDVPLYRCLIILDEAHIFLDSRNAQAKKNKLVSYFLLQTRKKGCHLYYTTQRFHQIDKRLRDNSDVLIMCKTKKTHEGVQFTMNNINILLENNIKQINEVFKSSDYYNHYNTFEVVKSV
jgi:DNA helicase HerA-like ATPase